MNKIVIIGPVLPYKGGLSHFNTSLINELKKSNDVHVISWKRQYPKIIYPIESVEHKDLKYIKNNEMFMLDFYNPFTWFNAVRKIKKINPDLVIFPWVSPIVSPFYSFILFFIKRNFSTLAICHNVSQHEETFLDNFLRKIFFRNVDSFLVHSRSDYEKLKSLVSNKKIILGFHPVYDMFKSNSNFNVKNNFRIFFFGYVRDYKGLIYLLRAMPKILKNLNVKLIIAGEFWESKKASTNITTKFVTGKKVISRRDYINEIKNLGLNDNVEIIDKYISNEEVGDYFAKSDILVLPYVSASQSGPVQVAYNFNIPVIVTNVGGLPDAVIEGKTGYVVEPKNPDSIADAVIKFYKNNKKGEFVNNIKTFKKKFSWDNYSKLIESLL